MEKMMYLAPVLGIVALVFAFVLAVCCYGHAKIASQRGEYRANNKADRRFPADAEANQQKQYNSENNQNFRPM